MEDRGTWSGAADYDGAAGDAVGDVAGPVGEG